MRRSDRSRRSGRRPSPREPGRLILVVCEGTTEREYLEGFKDVCSNPRVNVRFRPRQGAPITMIDYAVDERRNVELRDEVWCVFDIDQHHHLPVVRERARQNGVELTISNPCFELWLLLHFRNSPSAPLVSALQAMLKQCLPGYDKHVDYPRDYAAYYEHAVKRAQRLDSEAEALGEAGRNPMTAVWRLTESIRREDA